MALGVGADRALGAPQRLGVFGGTFDPIHLGHLIVAEQAREALSLDHVLFVPARISPLKHGTSFSVEDRYRMVELALADDSHFSPSRLDIDRSGPSFTVETLATLKRQYPSTALYFIMGADSLETLALWRRPDEIIRLARIVALRRPGTRVDLEELERALPGINAATDLVHTLQIDISSTDIRERLDQGRSIRYLVPDAVERYIMSQRMDAAGTLATSSC